MKSKSFQILIISITILFLTSVFTFAYDFGEHDLEGETVTLLMLEQYTPMLDRYFDGRGAGLIQETEDKFNCEIELRTIGDPVDLIERQISRFMAGDSQYDIWQLRFERAMQLAADGMLFPVGEILSSEYYDEYLPSVLAKAAKNLKWKGNVFGFGDGFKPIAGADHIQLLNYNKEIFEREGLPDLQELYNKGEWTWEKMKELAEKATKEDRGIITQWGIADGNYNWWNTLFLAASSNTPYQIRENDKIKINVTSEGFIATMEYMNQLIDNELIGGFRPQFLNGHAAMMFNSPGWFQTSVAREVDFDFGVVPHPRPPWHNPEDKYQAFIAMLNIIPANSSNPEAMIAIHHSLFPAEKYDPESHFERAVRDKKSYEILKEMYNDYNLVMTQYIWAEERVDIGPVYYTGESTPTAEMEKQKPSLQAAIDDILGQ